MSDIQQAGNFFEVALTHEENGRVDEAIICYTEAIRLYPRFADAYYQRGQLFLGRGDYALAVDDFDAVLELNPQNVAVYYERGVGRYLLGDYDHALTDFERVLSVMPNHDQAREGYE
ncbi:MAG: tetratricopeptide repeat protein, partial [Anaerolineae bacterium]|nr:tetratricopeptide repeat protein [Anaerolineae bacterium]